MSFKNTVFAFLESITQSKISSGVIINNPSKATYLGLDLEAIIRENFRKSGSSLKNIDIKEVGNKVSLDFHFNSPVNHKVKVEFIEVSDGNYSFTLLADSKGVRINSKIKYIDDENTAMFFKKLDHALYLIHKKYRLDENFSFGNHKDVTRLLDRISQLLIV